MKHRFSIAVGIALLANAVMAQENEAPGIETLDLTMELMPEGATRPDAITRIIELPAAAAEAARENSARGIDSANSARERGEPANETAEAARERGREQAQQSREDRGRGGGPPEGAGPPEVPGGGQPGGGPRGGGPPENPGPPETPGPPGG
jgi:hypothetical protein